MADSSHQSDKPQIEIASDEDWKTRVKSEDAKLDAQARAQQPAQQAEQQPVENNVEMTENDDQQDDQQFDAAQLPQASILTLLQMLSSQAILGMGLMPGPDGKTSLHLPVAKHFIDLLSVLEQKCKGNLSAEESRFLDGTLHELRMAYLDVSKKQG